MNKQIKAVHLIKEKDLVETFNSPFDLVENIEPEGYLVKNICLMGRKESANNRIYSDKSLDSLVNLSNGAKCYINHISKEEIKQRSGVRDLRDWVGCFESPYRKGDAVFANLKVRESYFGLIKDIATMKPKGIGHSIDARVKAFQDEKTGMESVVDIARLNSCDLVSEAAMVSNLFESINTTVETSLKNTPEILISDEYIKLKIDKLFQEALVQEGVIQDKMDKEKMQYALNDLTYTANDMIRSVLCEDELSIEDKKSKITAIFDDLAKEIKTKLKGMKENEKMLTIEQLKLENADLVKAIIEEYKKDQDVVGVKSTLEQTQKWYDAVEADYKNLQNTIVQKEKEVEYMIAACKEAEKQRDEVKVKLDEVEVLKKQNDKKIYIEAMIEQSKLTKEAKTEVFFNTLMKEDDVKVIESLITDRINLLASDGKVRNSGKEFDPAKILESEKKATESKEKLDEITDKFVTSKKQR